MTRTNATKIRLLTLRSGAPGVEEYQAVLFVGGAVKAAERGATPAAARAAVLEAAGARGLPVPQLRRRFA